MGKIGIMRKAGDSEVYGKIIIIGAGPAGISAALYAARANMNPLVINNGIGALEKQKNRELLWYGTSCFRERII